MGKDVFKDVFYLRRVGAKIALIWHQKINELYHVGQGLTSEIFLWLLNFFVKETLWRKLEIVS